MTPFVEAAAKGDNQRETSLVLRRLAPIGANRWRPIVHRDAVAVVHGITARQRKSGDEPRGVKGKPS
jgi:hypothetical protein